MTRSFFSVFFCIFVSMIFPFSSTQAQSPISFTISFTEPQAHYVDVEMVIPNVKGKYVDVKMPVWAPGSYLIREFSRNVESFGAFATSGKAMDARKINKNTWRIDVDGEKEVSLKYRVYAFEVSVRTSFVDDAHAFLSPTGIFMYVDKQLDRPAEVIVKPFAGWSKVSTGLAPIAGEDFKYSSPNFDVLFDSPFEIGNQDVFTFEAAGIPHEVAMYGGGNYNKERLAIDMKKIVEHATRIYGENPNKRYVFIVHNYLSGGGGLEHLNSTVLGASRFNYATENGYKGFLGLVAHEYFHLWNIKRLRPAALGPFDYDQENYTTNLWIGEGFTAYYDNLLVYRSGFYTESNYLDVLASDVTAVENRPGNQVQSLSEASLDAWIKYYRQDENSVNSLVSYYNKGALMAMMLDLKVLAATNGTKGLDDVMKTAYAEFYKKRDKGYTDAEFKELAEGVAGVALDDIWDMVNNPGTPDYNRFLSAAGLELLDLNEGYDIPDLGLKTSVNDGKLIVSGVIRGGSAWDGGINAKDELIAINGYRLDSFGRELDRAVQAAKIGDTLDILLSRGGLIKDLKITVSKNTTGRYAISPIGNPTEQQLQIRNAWLKQD